MSLIEYGGGLRRTAMSARRGGGRSRDWRSWPAQPMPCARLESTPGDAGTLHNTHLDAALRRLHSNKPLMRTRPTRPGQHAVSSRQVIAADPGPQPRAPQSQASTPIPRSPDTITAPTRQFTLPAPGTASAAEPLCPATGSAPRSTTCTLEQDPHKIPTPHRTQTPHQHRGGNRHIRAFPLVRSQIRKLPR
jgi:hypothetical protein